MITDLDWLSLTAIVAILSSGVAIELAYYFRLEITPEMAVLSAILLVSVLSLVLLFT